MPTDGVHRNAEACGNERRRLSRGDEPCDLAFTLGKSAVVIPLFCVRDGICSGLFDARGLGEDHDELEISGTAPKWEGGHIDRHTIREVQRELARGPQHGGGSGVLSGQLGQGIDDVAVVVVEDASRFWGAGEHLPLAIEMEEGDATGEERIDEGAHGRSWRRQADERRASLTAPSSVLPINFQSLVNQLGRN